MGNRLVVSTTYTVYTYKLPKPFMILVSHLYLNRSLADATKSKHFH